MSFRLHALKPLFTFIDNEEQSSFLKAYVCLFLDAVESGKQADLTKFLALVLDRYRERFPHHAPVPGSDGLWMAVSYLLAILFCVSYLIQGCMLFLDTDSVSGKQRKERLTRRAQKARNIKARHAQHARGSATLLIDEMLVPADFQVSPAGTPPVQLRTSPMDAPGAPSARAEAITIRALCSD